MPTIAIVVAMDTNRGIGKDNKLPWKLPGELKHFKKLTTTTQSPNTTNAVLMGRKTWESLPKSVRPLPGRFNMVLSRQNLDLPNETACYHSLEKALSICESPDKKPIETIFIIGGNEIFKEAFKLSVAQSIYLTQIQTNFECDTFLAPFESNYEVISDSSPIDENNVSYSFKKLVRH